MTMHSNTERETNAFGALLQAAYRDAKTKGLPRPRAIRVDTMETIMPPLGEPPEDEAGREKWLVSLFKGGSLELLHQSMGELMPEVGQRWALSYLGTRDAELVVIVELVEFSEPATTASLMRTEIRLEVEAEHQTDVTVN